MKNIATLFTIALASFGLMAAPIANAAPHQPKPAKQQLKKTAKKSVQHKKKAAPKKAPKKQVKHQPARHAR